MKKRTLSLLLAVACALSLSGCGGAPAPDRRNSVSLKTKCLAIVKR